jgi:pimeloyl-ACP methyl ester carboxylesterase
MPYAVNAGIRTYYAVSGEGPPLVLLHANPFDRNNWLYQTARFSTYFKVLAVDIRGFGLSDKPTQASEPKELIDDVVAVCRQEGARQAIVGGISVGATMAQLLALDHPELVRALILVGGSSGPKAKSKYDGRVDGYGKEGVAGYHVKHLTSCVTPGFAATSLGKYLIGQFVERDPTLDTAAVIEILKARGRMDATPRLPEIRVPTLVINGEHDGSLGGGTKTAALVPGAIHKVLPGLGHCCNLEDPGLFDRVVMEFLKEKGLLPTATALS